MDVREFLRYIADNPPEPFFGGCIKRALRPLLLSLRIMAAYHEHGRYSPEEIRPNCEKKESQHKSGAATRTPAPFGHVKPFSVASDAPNLLFHRTGKPAPISTVENANNGHENSIIRRRDTISNDQSKDNGVAPYQADTNLGTVKINGLTSNGQCSKTSLESCGDFLTRCGIVDKSATKEIIKSLGYDVPSFYSMVDEAKDEDLPKKPQTSWVKSLWSDRTYSFLVIFLMWLYLLRNFMFLQDSHGLSAMTMLIPILWEFMVVSTNTAFFVSCVRTDHFHTFFRRWSTLFKDPATRALGLRGVVTTTYIKVAVTVQWLLTFANVSAVMFIMMMEDSFSAGMNIAFYLTAERTALDIALSAILLTFFSFAWIGNTSFITVLCHVICSHFQEFNQVTRLHIAAAASGFPKSLALLRERHLAMCDTVLVLDRFVGAAIGFTYSVTIGLNCLILFQLVNSTMDTTVMAIAVFWLVSGVVLMAVITYNMAGVNIAMHSVGDELYTIQTSKLTVEELSQLQMFLAKVNGPSMGFTVMGMTTVTRELMLTLFGLLLTYAVVLLQFQ